MYKFAVVGAGVVGGLVARELARYEKNIVILEKANDVAMGQSKANSGIVHAGYDPEPGTLKAILNVKGAEMMEKVCEDLSVKYKNNGALIVGYDDEDRKQLEVLLERGKKNGVKRLEIIDGENVRKLEKNLSKRINCALYAPTSGIVCPYELTIHAVGCAMDNGAELRTNFEVADIKKTGDFWTIVSKSGAIICAENIVNCAGIYSDKIAKLVGDDSFEVNGRRGEYFLLDKDAGDLVTMTIFRTPSKMGKGVLAVKTVDGNILLGPTSEDIDEKDLTETTKQGLDAVRSKEYEFFDNIPWDKAITQFTGVRSHGSTHDFIINSPAENFVNCAGVESPGLTSAPAIALMVIDLFKQAGVELVEREDYEPKLVGRLNFSQMSFEEKNELIKKRPEFGHIVCRCEEITEGEIIEAIRQNPPAKDVDAVKRRVRAGMGRCQGGFCMPIVCEILAKELGVSYDEITKKGKDSNYTYGKTKLGGKLVCGVEGGQNE